MHKIKNIFFILNSLAEGQELQRIASLGGYSSQVLTNPFYAIDRIGQENPDLVVVDERLPSMSGYEFCRKIKSRRHSAIIPLIVLSEQKQREEHFRILGIDAFVTKPIDEYFLLSRMTICLLTPKIIDPGNSLSQVSAGLIRKHMILVVTPVTELAISMVRILMKMEQEVASANNLEEAIAHADFFTPDIYFIDSDGAGKRSR